MLAPRQHQRVNHALGLDWRFGRARQLGIEKGDVKAALCATSGAPPTNAMNLSATAPNSGLSAKNSADKPCQISL
jgi:hypothetical protein